MLIGLLVFGSIVAAAIWFAMTYNNLVTAVHRANQAWGNIDTLLRQRHDEIQRVIDLCQPRLKYEQATFDRVLEARGEIFGARQTQDTATLGRAENTLRGALRQVLALAAAQEELNSDATLAALQQRLTTLETGIAERAALYDDAVQQNNRAISQFPGVIVAVLGGFRRLQPFALDGVERDG